MRLTVSYEPITGIRHVQQKVDYKPKGLWYAIGDAWKEFVRTDMSSRPEAPYEYEVVLKKDHGMLMLNTVDKVINFNRMYGTTHIPDPRSKRGERGETFDLIDWDQVADDFTGIELCPYFYEIRFDMIWYYTIDIESGCIWNADAIDRLNQLKP